MTYIFTGAATFFCIYFRYQTLLPESARLTKVLTSSAITKFNWATNLLVKLDSHLFQPKSAALIVFCLFACVVPASAYAFMPFDLSRVEHMMITVGTVCRFPRN